MGETVSDGSFQISSRDAAQHAEALSLDDCLQ